jgi:hypothetical protein
MIHRLPSRRAERATQGQCASDTRCDVALFEWCHRGKQERWFLPEVHRVRPRLRAGSARFRANSASRCGSAAIRGGRELFGAHHLPAMCSTKPGVAPSSTFRLRDFAPATSSPGSTRALQSPCSSVSWIARLSRYGMVWLACRLPGSPDATSGSEPSKPAWPASCVLEAPFFAPWPMKLPFRLTASSGGRSRVNMFTAA